MKVGVGPSVWSPVPAQAGRYGCGALAAAVFGLALADLVSVTLCVVAATALGLIAWNMPRLNGSRWRDWPGRSPVAVLVLTLVSIAGWATVPGGGTESVFPVAGPFGSLQVGTLAALAAGALVAVGLECGERRGLRSGLLLGIAVLALTTVSLPGPDLLPALLSCWPATLLALARVATTVGVSEGVRAPVEVSRAPGSGLGDRVRPMLSELRRVAVPLIAATAAGAVLFVVAVWVRPDVGAFGGPGGSGFGGDSFGGSRSTSTYLGGQMNLRRRGGLSDEPVARVPADSPRLWRAATLDTYTGSTWNAIGPAGTRSAAALVGDGTAEVRPPPGSTPPTTPATAAVEVLGDLRQIIAPGQLLSVDAPRLRFVAARPGDALDVSTSSQLRFQAPSEYRVTSAPLPDADDPGLRLPSDRAGEPDPVYSLLPPALPARVRDLGRRLVGEAPDRLAAVRAVEREVRARMVYRLDSPVPKLGTDAVDDVLFTSHSGFCEQFASAAAVLLRAGGVPTRVAVGFSGGEPDGASRIARQSDAHAWIEVWFPGTGWVQADPTPPGDLEQTWLSSVRTSVQAAARAVQRLFLVNGPWLPLSLIAGFALLLALPGLVRRLRSGPRRASAVDPRLASSFARLERALRAVGTPREPDETVAALADRLGLPVLLVLERALYAPVPPSAGECAAAAAEIEGAARDLRRVHA